MTANFPGIVFVRVPGVSALPLVHLLRAVFGWRDVDAAGLPESALSADSVLAGHFGPPETLPARYPGLARDSRCLRLTAVEDPLRIQCAVYRHLCAADPELPVRRSARFGSLERFLASRDNPLTSHLSRAVGVRRVSVRDFDGIWCAEDSEASLLGVVEKLRRRAAALGEPRQQRLLDRMTEYSGELARAFDGKPDGEPSPEISPETARDFRRRNASDEAFYRECLSRPEIRPRRRWPHRRVTPVPPEASEPVFVFNHLPKSHGTSVRAFFQRAFAVVEDHTRFLDAEGLLADAPVDVRWLAADTLLAGHFCHEEFLLQRRYPRVWEDRQKFHLFTFVREPLETAVSNYRHVTTRYPEVVARSPELYASLENYLGALANPIARRLGCTEETLDQTLARYFFVGDVREGDRGLCRLLEKMTAILDDTRSTATVRRAQAALAMLRGQCEMPRENSSSRSALMVAPVAVASFRERNRLDYLLYDRIQA